MRTAERKQARSVFESEVRKQRGRWTCAGGGVWYDLGVPPEREFSAIPLAALSLPQKLRRIRALSYTY